jgi:nucleoside-diphosphate-sugar epimerase
MIDHSKIIACVTGASAVVGSRIVERLLKSGYKVRVLSRGYKYPNPNVELFSGTLDNEELLGRFMFNADLLFHCAAELRDESKMWEVNVRGTEKVLRAAKLAKIKYLCYISSAGVVGKTSEVWVDENTECNPQNTYEKTKWEAEKLVAEGIDSCSVVILRPTNIVDERRYDAISSQLVNNSCLNSMKLFVKGGECAHVVHAEDVARAAIHFSDKNFRSPQCYFVSRDEEPLNIYAGLRAVCDNFRSNYSFDDIKPVLHLPLFVPYALRRIWRGMGNRGDVRYSSRKIISEGFSFSYGMIDIVKNLFSASK